MIVATLVRKDQIVHAIALAKSVKAHHPEVMFVACLVQHHMLANLTMQFDEVVLITNNNFPAETSENYCAARAYFIKHLLATYENETLLYLDPETQVYSRFEEVIALLEQHPIIAVPFHLEPTDSSIEIEQLHSGFLHAGFLALRNTDIAKRFAAWWSNRIDRNFYGAQSGIYGDHKWLSLAMVPFHIHLLKDSAYQVAPWNLHEANRQMEATEDGRLLISGKPLRSFHYTLSQELVEHQLRTKIVNASSPINAMVQTYRDALLNIRLEGGIE